MNPFYGAPIINLFSHGLGRLLIKSTSFKNSMAGRKLSEIGERIMYQAMKAGIDGKKISEGRMAALGSLSPSISSSVGVAHELGSKARELGIESPEKLLDYISKVSLKMESMRRMSSNIKKALPYMSSGGAGAIGGLTGAAVTSNDGSKAKNIAIGAMLGTTGGLIGYKILANSIARKIKEIGINQAKINKLYDNAKNVTDIFDKVKKIKPGIVDKLTKVLFVS